MTINWTPNRSDPEVFHITHVNNLPSIEKFELLSDRQVAVKQMKATTIGDLRIKQRRLHWKLNLSDQPIVGDFVPFYFCPRSVMLYRIWRGATGRTTDQENIVHLVSCVSRLANLGQRCVFTDVNAATSYAEASEDLTNIPNDLNWSALMATNWQNDAIKADRQAEFLVANAVPWSTFDSVVVKSQNALQDVQKIFHKLNHQPLARIESSWYYN